VVRMLELARNDPEMPYAGSRSQFGEMVRRIRQDRDQEQAETQDLGLQARAIAAGVPVLRLSDDSLLPPEGEAQWEGLDLDQ
jgi:hypothetical protein